MASEKQKMARTINWNRARLKGCKHLNFSVNSILKDKELYNEWDELIDKTYEKLKGAYL